MLLDVKNLHCAYGNIEVLKGISVSASDGETVGILGANGAGKTTLLKTISGFVKASDGEIVFDGQKINNLRPGRITKLGVSQIPRGRTFSPR